MYKNMSFWCYKDDSGEYLVPLDWKWDDMDFYFFALHLFPIPFFFKTNIKTCKIDESKPYSIKDYTFFTADWYDKTSVVLNVFMLLLLIYLIVIGIIKIIKIFIAGIKSSK